MDKERFSLLLLEPGEIYFEDFSAVFIPSDTTSSNYDYKKQDGRLKMCSKSLVFDPKDISKPLIKISLKNCVVIEEWKGKAKFIKSKNVLSVNCREYTEMLEGNITAPYKFKESGNFLFLFNYAKIANCLNLILQLQRASKLPSADQSNMITAIVYSVHSRVNFDPFWLDLYEKIITESQVDKVCPLNINPGKIVLSTMKLYFQPYNNIENNLVIKINLNSIKQVFKRRFLLRHIGLEIYSSDSTNSHIYLSFRNQKERDNFYDSLLAQPELKLDNIEKNFITLQWQNGIISNYEYLQYINSLGDRTVNDLTQYPVFPWIITDYTSDELDLSNEKNYRDLSKPIGALNPERLQRLLDRYNEMSSPKFIYGSHYSTPGFVLYYLARLYPHYVLCMQGGRFDHPDRMFNSVADAFRNCFSNMSDFKELIPEFYDTSGEGKFLLNNLGINFGLRHNNLKVGDVELPPWAENPKHFVSVLKEALESDIVSNNIHHWIDLIFGYKQKGDEALKANNLFYHLCYEGNLDLDSIVDANERHAFEVQIMEFGQIPKQVFTVPHPRRKIGIPLLTEPFQIQEEEVLEDIWKNVKDLQLKATFNSHKTSVSQIHISEDGSKITSVGHDSKLKVFCLNQNRQIRSANIGDMPLSSCIPLSNGCTVIIGSWDNQILFYDLDYGKITTNALAHEDTVTCMALGEKSPILVSGSSDCSVKVWRNVSANARDLVIDCLYKHLDHNSAVNCLCFDRDDNHLAVGTEDGELYIWEMSNFTLYKKFNLPSGINAMSYSSEKLAVGCNKGHFEVLDVNTGMSVFNITLKSPICSMKWKGHLLVIGCNNGTLSLWDMFEVKVLLEKLVHSGPITTVDVSKDKNIIASGSRDKLIKIWTPSNEFVEKS
ncbi:hypothetical protein GWI33_017614 [Rhynchophorus ferrugineus]|uniref:Uncharacterized protein n=1 Tax=Rhynchophorus ferrugineus TaxID=354439 RepID=A0A834HZE4_RHYFE|nr:hypothetical protein GWI33_017614 [Rhynchophorus ferrugineus]